MAVDRKQMAVCFLSFVSVYPFFGFSPPFFLTSVGVAGAVVAVACSPSPGKRGPYCLASGLCSHQRESASLARSEAVMSRSRATFLNFRIESLGSPSPRISKGSFLLAIFDVFMVVLNVVRMRVVEYSVDTVLSIKYKYSSIRGF
jgi:hypothetical protein